MNLIDWTTLILVLVILGAQIFYRRSFGFLSGFLKTREKFDKFLKVIWGVSGAVIFGTLLYWSVIQFEIWQSSELTKYFLPPYQGISYFISYVGVRFFSPWAVAFLASFLISRMANFLNKKFDERFFEKEEIRLMALGIFLTGYPGFLFYLLTILILGVLVAGIYTTLTKQRLPLYYFWLPMAFFAMIIKYWFLGTLHLTSFWGELALGDFYKLIFGF